MGGRSSGTAGKPRISPLLFTSDEVNLGGALVCFTLDYVSRITIAVHHLYCLCNRGDSVRAALTHSLRGSIPAGFALVLGEMGRLRSLDSLPASQSVPQELGFLSCSDTRAQEHPSGVSAGPPGPKDIPQEPGFLSCRATRAQEHPSRAWMPFLSVTRAQGHPSGVWILFLQGCQGSQTSLRSLDSIPKYHQDPRASLRSLDSLSE